MQLGIMVKAIAPRVVKPEQLSPEQLAKDAEYAKDYSRKKVLRNISFVQYGMK